MTVSYLLNEQNLITNMRRIFLVVWTAYLIITGRSSTWKELNTPDVTRLGLQQYGGCVEHTQLIQDIFVIINLKD